MITLATDNINHDLIVVDGQLVLYDGVDQIAQAIREAIAWFFGEWFLNNAGGVPWFQQILVANPNLDTIQAILINTVLSVPGVVIMNSFVFGFEPGQRALSVTMSVTTTNGQTVNLEQTVGI